MNALMAYHALSRINPQSESDDADSVKFTITINTPPKEFVPLMSRAKLSESTHFSGGGYTGNSDGAGYTGWNPGPVEQVTEGETSTRTETDWHIGLKAGVNIRAGWIELDTWWGTREVKTHEE
jgi:hypothetical protein